MTGNTKDNTYWQSDAFQRRIVDSARDGIWVIDADERTVFVNPRMLNLLGCTETDILGHSLADFTDAEGRAQVRERLARRRAGTGEQFDLKLIRRDGGVISVLVEAQPLFDDDGTYAGSVKVVTDISRRVANEQELRKLQEQLSVAEQLAFLGSWTWDVKTNKVTWSDELYSIYGLPRTTQINFERFLAALHPLDRERVRTQITNAFNTRQPFQFNERVVRPDGSVRHLLSRGRVLCNPQGEAERLIGICMDVTARIEGEAQLHHVMYHDSVTGLPNRYVLQERGPGTLERAQRNQRESAVIMLGLDRFKTINESLGFETGDAILHLVADRLRKAVHNADLVVHTGGDEFVVVLEDLDRARDVATVARRLLEAVNRPLELNGRTFRLTASGGVACFPDDSDNITALVQYADLALTRAKKAGRNRFEFYSADLGKTANHTLRIIHELDKAIEHDEFHLAYQPRIDLASGAIAGVEALIRWQPSGQAVVSPMDFIPIAEETGQIVPIGLWVLHTACRDAMAWRKQGLPAFPVAVNVSTRQQLDAGFVDKVRAVLEDTGFPAHELEFEITESMSMQADRAALAVLDRLHRLGVTICVDDFGMGYSSFSRLMQLPINIVKIDRSFIRNITDDESSMAVTEAVIALSRRRHLRTIAEGIETETQLDTVRAMGCDEAQGFLFSRPLPGNQLVEFVNDWRNEFLQQPAAITHRHDSPTPINKS